MMAALRAIPLAAVALLTAGVPVQATPVPEDAGTTTPSPTLTADATPSATPRATWTPRPTATATPPPVIREPDATPTAPRRRRRRTPRPTGALTFTPTPNAVREPTRTRRQRSRRRRPTRTPTPSPTPTPTPLLNLNTDDTISPVTCNGPGKPVATRPFLTPPYSGFTTVVSYFDHDSPNYLRDGLTIAATGAQASPDPAYVRTDFPAYWDPALRLYLDYDGHNGYDFDVSYQPIYAAAPGRVIYAHMEYPTMPDHGYGNMIMIRHRGGYVTLYGHLKRFLVKKGQRVRRGQQIAVSGNTGRSTGPHLHFSVFHNCTPTDPYGWVGGGPDPLIAYRGESSVNLWQRAPELVNPLPGWPGLAQIPAESVTRILLLKLPPTDGGTRVFTAALRARARQVARAAGGPGHARVDMLRGAVITNAYLTAAAIYRIPGVVAISSPDVVDGARTNVLAAVARAALVAPAGSRKLIRSRSWRGYLLSWQGRTVLVGRGARGAAVRVRLGPGRAGIRKLVTDPTTGTYAVDLGTLSAAQRSRLQRRLTGAARAQVTPAPVRKDAHRPARTAARQQGISRQSDVLAPGISLGAILAILGSIILARHGRRRGTMPAE